MEYGSSYTRSQRSSDDDGAAMLRDSQYQAYNPEHRRHSSDALSPSSRWNVSPIVRSTTQTARRTSQAISATSPVNLTAALDAPHQEPAAWEYATYTSPIERSSSGIPKPEAQTSFTSLPGTDSARGSRQYFRHPRHIPAPWKPGFWIRFPWLGFGAVLSILLCMGKQILGYNAGLANDRTVTGVNAGILLASDGSNPNHWKIGSDNAQPSVYVSIFEMITIFLTLFALTNGMVIKFWRQMMRGTTVCVLPSVVPHDCTDPFKLSAIHDTYESYFLGPALGRLFRLQVNRVTIGK